MADETYTDAPVSVTLKAGTGYDAPWIVLKGTVEEVESDLQEILQTGKDDGSFVQLVSETAALLHGVYTVTKGTKGNDDSPPWKEEEEKTSRTSSRSQGSSSGRSSTGRGTRGSTHSTLSSDGGGEVSKRTLKCEHGDAERKVTRKWIGYFCPVQDKASQCKPAFFDTDDDPEG